MAALSLAQPPAAQQVFLLRHGETAWSASGQHTGTSDVPLTARGREEAGRLREALRGAAFALVLSSPLARARETCELAGLGGRAQLDPGLAEWRYGEYEGLTTPQIEKRAPGWMVFTHGAPGGETPEEVGARIDRVLARVREAPGDVALFGHGHALRVLAARWIGLPAQLGRHFELATGTLSVLGHYHGGPAIRLWNAPPPSAPARAPA